MTSSVANQGSHDRELPNASAMNGDSNRDVNPRVFWLVLIATWMLSFLTQHDIYFSVEGAATTAEQMADDVTEGSLLRRLVLPMLGVIGLLCLVRHGLRHLRINGVIGWALLAFFLWMNASVLWSEDAELSGRRLITYGCLLIGAFGVATVAFERLALFVAAFCGLNLVVGILVEASLGTFHPGTTGYRFGGTVHPNLQGVNIALLILALSWFLAQSNLNFRKLTMGVLLCAFLFLLLTQSRTSIGSLCVVLLYSFSMSAVRVYGLRCLALPVTVISLLASLLLLAAILVPDAALSDLATGTIVTERDSGDPMSLTGRVDLWQTILDYAAQRPILGYGHDAFWSPSRIEDISKGHQWSINQAHNAYLEWLLNLGVVGVSLYTIAMACTWVMCLRLFINGNEIFGFASALLLFIMLHNCLESINALPVFSSFFTFIVLFHAGFITSWHQK